MKTQQQQEQDTQKAQRAFSAFEGKTVANVKFEFERQDGFVAVVLSGQFTDGTAFVLTVNSEKEDLLEYRFFGLGNSTDGSLPARVTSSDKDNPLYFVQFRRVCRAV